MNYKEIIFNDEKLDLFIDKMVRANNFDGILNYEIVGNSIRVDLDGLESFETIFKSRISFEKIEEIILDIDRQRKSLKDFMIGEEWLRLSINSIYFDIDGNMKIMLLPIKNEKSDIRNLFIEIFSTCIIESQGRDKALVDISNYLNMTNYSFEGLVNRFFTKTMSKEKNDGIIKTNPPIKPVIEEKIEAKSPANKDGYFSKFKRFFEPKDYKVKDLDIDFKLPKKNS